MAQTFRDLLSATRKQIRELRIDEVKALVDAKRPVKILLTHSEELMAMNPDHDTVVRIKTGVKRDGTMTARYLQAIHGTGAYAGMKPGRASIGGAGTAGPYKIEHT